LNLLNQHWQILGILHSVLHHILYYARITIMKMQYRVNFLVDSLYNITTWRTIANINNCYCRCAHTQAQHTAPEQTSPRVSNSHNIFKWQWSNYI